MRLVLITLLLLGLVYRLWPTVAGMPALANFFMTEDGYLLLTVSRNMAIGLGMTVSDGTIPTNGVQPLMTFLFTLPYLATQGDKVTSLIGVHLIHAVISITGAFAVRNLAARILAPRDISPVWPWAVALLWFLGPHLVRHSMNGLETALYTLVLLTTLLVFARVVERGDEATTRLRLGLGALCGLTVLTRVDGVFLVTAIFTVWAAIELFVTRAGFSAMLGRLMPPGFLSIAVAAPWLLNNLLRFGSVVPVSGTAQSFNAHFGQNAGLLPTKLFEHTFPMLPLPWYLEIPLAVKILAAAAVGLALVLLTLRLWRFGTPTARAIVLAYAGHGAALSFYYGFIFGAPHFLGRYLAPLAPLLIVAALAAMLELGRWLVRARPEALAWIYSAGGVAIAVALLIRALAIVNQGHTQVVAWTEANVPGDVWVGAVQTGTLGYWHDRTYNLDGKVNPAALAAALKDGHILNYVVDSPIQYVIDWPAVGDWVTFPEAQGGFAEEFELILKDERRGLSVMKRRN